MSVVGLSDNRRLVGMGWCCDGVDVLVFAMSRRQTSQGMLKIVEGFCVCVSVFVQ